MSSQQSLTTAIEAFSQYYTLSHVDLSRMRSTLNKLPRYNKRLAYDVGYTEKLNTLDKSISSNAKLASAIAAFGRAYQEADGSVPSPSSWPLPALSTWLLSYLNPYAYPSLTGQLNGPSPDIGQVRDMMRHYVRDWSEEAREEREGSLRPVLDVLMAELALRKGERKGRKPRVFVPGCGLGRLAWEVSELGYDTTALDFSSYASLALRFLLSSSTHTRNQHAMQPFAYYLPHQRSNANLFRTVRIPDVVPREEPGSFTFLQGDFLKHRPPPPSPSPNSKEKGKEGKGGYDYIVTLFFLDTAADVFTYLSHIHSLLAPGGLWINLGPLLWTSGYTACPALSLEEVLEAVKRSGFALLGEGDAGGNGVGGGKRGGGGNGKSGKELLGGLPLDLVKRRPIQCGYTADKHAMMSYEYHAEFWVARKVVDSL